MDELTPAEAADAARRIIGQIEALQAWARAHGLRTYVDLGEAVWLIEQVRSDIVQLDRRPAAPAGGGR